MPANSTTSDRSDDATIAALGPAPQLGVDGRVLEGLVATVADDGGLRLAPMGPIVDEQLQTLWLRPFRTSTTYQNLRRTGEGVFHLTDDVELLARAAVGLVDPPPRTAPAAAVRGFVLADACRWFAFRAVSWDESGERVGIGCQVVARGVLRDFAGFNRAKHAVVEAAILATRVQYLAPDAIAAELARLAPLVIKTGAAAEHRAFEFLRAWIAQQHAQDVEP